MIRKLICLHLLATLPFAVYGIATAQEYLSASASSAEKQLVIELVDPAGKPIQKAKVGSNRSQWDYFNPRTTERRGSITRWSIAGRRMPPKLTDDHGTVRIPIEQAFRRHATQVFYGWAPSRGLVGLHTARRDNSPLEFQLKLQPACLVFGQIESSQLQRRNIPMLESQACVSWNGTRVLSHHSTQSRFEFILPAGQYELRIGGYGLGVGKVSTGGVPLEERLLSFSIKPEQHILDLGTFDLSPTELGTLVGKQAPELRGIRGWKNSEPLSLADLRGKYVLLEFWGHWCGPCTVNMPWLFGIHDRYAKHGLVVIGIHDNRAESISDLDEKLKQARTRFWNGRDLPFPVAIDGGEGGHGATHQAYRINAWPTWVLIDPDGRLVHVFENPHLSFFDQLLKTKKAQP